jgi:hypothetical protein
MLDQLARLGADDYEWVAELAVREIVPSTAAYADPAAVHARLAAPR